MIRIQAANNPGGITIAIDGQLIGEYVAEVEDSIRKSMEQYNDVHLFLRNVSHIDEDGPRATLSTGGPRGGTERHRPLQLSRCYPSSTCAEFPPKPGKTTRRRAISIAFGTAFRRLTSALAEASPERPLSR